MNNIINFNKNYNITCKHVAIGYCIVSFLHFSCLLTFDSLLSLLQYSIGSNISIYVNSNIQALMHGFFKNFMKNFISSIFWPISLFNNIKNKDEKDEKIY